MLEKVRLAQAAIAAGDHLAAERLSREILAQEPGNADALSWLGIALAGQGRRAEAAQRFRDAAAARPDDAGMHLNLGNALADLNELDGAISSYERALQLQPDYPQALNSLGCVLELRSRPGEAIARYRQAIALAPDYAEAWDNLGEALLQQGREEEAEDSFRRALELQPDHPDFHCDLGNALSAQGRSGDAIPEYERALALDPAFADARYSLSIALLFRHDFARGWAEYERRAECAPMRRSMRREAGLASYERLKQWRGPAEMGAPDVAIWAEQGLGDQLLFSTLIPELIRAGVRFTYEVDGRLLPAYQRAFPGCRFARLEESPRPELLAASRALLAGSLPRLFRASAADFSRQPARLLAASEKRVAYYRSQLALLGPGLKVALSWRSTRRDYWGPKKNAPLAHFAPLLRQPGVHFVDVQYGDTAAERGAAETATGARIRRFEVDHYNDLDEVLAILEACDLLITVSNVTAHLAGALGKPAWLLYLADRPPFHYWSHGGSGRSLWYPSVEVVSAPHLTDWDALIAQVRERLTALRP